MRRRHTNWIVLSAAVLLLGGCSTLRAGVPFGRGVTRDGPVIRPDAPAEYDVLVAQQLAVDGRATEALGAYQRAVEKDPESSYLHRKLAAVLAQHNRLDDAIAHAERALELDPEDEPSRLFVGHFYRIKRRTGDAEDVLTRSPGEPVSVDAAFLLYQIYLEAGRTDDALDIAGWMVERDPGDSRARIAVANAYQRMDRAKDAEVALREALGRDPENLRLYGALGRLFRQRGDHVAEVELYREILDRHPNHHQTLVALGDAQLALDDVDGALATFMIVEERFPEDLHSAVRMGYLFFEARRFLEARGRFERAMATGPVDYEVAFFLGVVDRRIGDSDAAIAAFAKIPEEHRYYPEARVQIATVFERRGEYRRALEEVERARAVRDADEMRLYSATLRAKAGDLESAVSEVEAMLDEQPDSDELLFNMGVVYGEADETDQAVAFMLRALEQNPDNASALNYIGYVWAEKGINLDEAESMIMRAIELRPDDGYIIDSLGWVYYMRARPLIESGREVEAKPLLDRALRELERAQKLTGGDPVVLEHIGDTYLLLDEKERALERFEEAILMEPRESEQPDLVEKLQILRKELR